MIMMRQRKIRVTITEKTNGDALVHSMSYPLLIFSSVFIAFEVLWKWFACGWRPSTRNTIFNWRKYIHSVYLCMSVFECLMKFFCFGSGRWTNEVAKMLNDISENVDKLMKAQRQYQKGNNSIFEETKIESIDVPNE